MDENDRRFYEKLLADSQDFLSKKAGGKPKKGQNNPVIIRKNPIK